MNAIFQSGGKQYLVTKGDKVKLEKLEGAKGDSIVFSDVLFMGAGETIEIGTPVVSGATIKATILKQGRGKKIEVLKYKAKSKYRRKIGHRQAYTEVQIDSIK